MADFQVDSNGRYRDYRNWFFGPAVNNRWGVFWVGWFMAACASRWIDELHLEMYALIAFAVLYFRGSLTRNGNWPQASAKPKQESSVEIERQPSQSISRTTYVLRQISFWLVLALVFLLFFNYFAPSKK
jgi:hypothetical protein